MELTRSQIDAFSESYHSDQKKEIIANAVIKNGINNVAMNHYSIAGMNYEFSEEIDIGKVTNQGKSGRCWAFAGLNNIRYSISKRLNIKDHEFELSQNYAMFWDKLEKANFFLENIIETRKEQVSSRNVMWLLNEPTQDGGQWDMFVSLIEKYGILPKYAMPEAYHSNNSRNMNALLDFKLRDCAMKLRKQKEKDEEALRSVKNTMLEEIYAMLCIFLGEPPKTFDLEYRDKKKQFHSDRNLTPQAFYKNYSGIDVADYISLINAPTEDKPYEKTYTVKFLGNIKGLRPIKYLNVENSELKALTIKQLKEGDPVWLGCDVGKFSDRELGIMDTELYHYKETLDTEITLSKADRLNYCASVLTHAMVFTGVDLADDKPLKWKVQNSWGDEPGEKGFFIMSDNWFDEYNYEVVIHKKHLPDRLKEAYKMEPTILEPWDPMGSLAKAD